MHVRNRPISLVYNECNLGIPESRIVSLPGQSRALIA